MLKSYDQHLNMILGEVEETVTSIEIDEETYEEVYKVNIVAYCWHFYQLYKYNSCVVNDLLDSIWNSFFVKKENE